MDSKVILNEVAMGDDVNSEAHQDVVSRYEAMGGRTVGYSDQDFMNILSFPPVPQDPQVVRVRASILQPQYLWTSISIFYADVTKVIPDYEPQYLHYVRHYADSVRSKGSLSSYSPDRMEIWHKPLKDVYK